MIIRAVQCAIIAIFSLCALCIVSASSVSAHELQQDKGISAVLHIPPDDNPQAGRELFLNLDFNSKSPGFDLRSCRCTVTARSGSADPISVPLISNDGSPTSGHAAINFAAAGIYGATVQGFVSGGQGDKFKLIYQLRVVDDESSNSQNDTNQGWQVVMLSITTLMLLGVVAAEMMKRGGRYNRLR